MDLPKHPQIRKEEKEIEDKVSTSSPPSFSTVSPSHEFSFTISLQSTPPPPTPSLNIPTSCNDDASTSSLARINLSPADKIFSGGQLPPLQAFSNTKALPHSSDSSENFTLPINDLDSDLSRRFSTTNLSSKSEPIKPKIKSIPDMFRIWRAKTEETELRNDNKAKANKKKLELGQVLKKFISMVENIFSNNRRERERRDLQKRPHSFSVPRETERWRKRRSQRSAPASMRGSPSHSGHFSVGSVNKLSSSSDESTMEELQNAIEAAIAHCKSSIAAKERSV